MSLIVKEVIVLAVWVVTLWRLPSLKGVLWQRALWVTFAGLAACLTFSLPFVDAFVTRLSGITALATLLKHLAGIVALTAVLTWVNALLKEQRPPKALLAIAMATATAMTAIFGFIPRRQGDFSEVMAGDPTATTYLLIFQTYLGAAMALGALMFFAAARTSPSRLVATSLWVLFCGTSLCAVYAVTRSAFLLGSIGVPLPGPTHAYFTISEVFQLTSVALIVIGTSIPAYRLSALSVAERRQLIGLRPLWRQVTNRVPGVLINGSPTLGADLRSAEIRLRLALRVTEVDDALLRLRAYIPDTQLRWVRDQLQTAGLDDQLDTAVEAAWLPAAFQAHEGGWPTFGSDLPMPGAPDLGSEVERLRGVHRAGRNPHVRRIASELTSRLTAASEQVGPSRRETP